MEAQAHLGRAPEDQSRPKDSDRDAEDELLAWDWEAAESTLDPKVMTFYFSLSPFLSLSSLTFLVKCLVKQTKEFYQVPCRVSCRDSELASLEIAVLVEQSTPELDANDLPENLVVPTCTLGFMEMFVTQDIFVCKRPDAEQTDTRNCVAVAVSSSLAQLGKQQHGTQVFQGQRRNL
ncbi:hypothetical protein BTVI_86999 [Pitangus sulphuratus]|nr:hypothetical protein BTVI_86999 [Pitangus sulphuratus]